LARKREGRNLIYYKQKERGTGGTGNWGGRKRKKENKLKKKAQRKGGKRKPTWAGEMKKGKLIGGDLREAGKGYEYQKESSKEGALKREGPVAGRGSVRGADNRDPIKKPEPKLRHWRDRGDGMGEGFL